MKLWEKRNPLSRMRMRKYGLLAGIAVMILVTAVLYGAVVGKTCAYYTPGHDVRAVQGIPEGIYLEEVAPVRGFRVGFQAPFTGEKGKIYFYLTNYAENDVFFSVFMYDKDKTLLAESELVHNGEYLPYLETERDMEEEYLLHIVGIDRQTGTSAGSFWVRLGKVRMQE